MELNWVKKQGTGGKPMLTDVRFNIDKQERVQITFSASAVNIKFNAAKHLVFAISGSRVYFKEEDSKYGYTVSRPDNTRAGLLQVTSKDLVDFLHKNSHFREANLRYDSQMGLYFVDASKRDLDWKENR